MRLKVIAILLLCCTILPISACGSPKKELENYAASIDQFVQDMNALNTSINQIDSSDEDALNQFHTYLDEMLSAYAALSSLSVPEEYAAAEQLSEDAYRYMQEAVTHFKAAYTLQAYSKEEEEMAYTYYEAALKCVHYMGYVMTGDIPEEEEEADYQTERLEVDDIFQ